MENEYTEIGKRIRAWRKAAKLTGEKLGESLEINKQTLSNYETAKTKIPIPVMIKAADFFGKSLDELITGHAIRARFQIVEKKTVLQTSNCDSCREGPPEWNSIGPTEKLIFDEVKKGDPELIHELVDVILKRRAKPEGNAKNGTEG